jgi:hypothetical protein
MGLNKKKKNRSIGRKIKKLKCKGCRFGKNDDYYHERSKNVDRHVLKCNECKETKCTRCIEFEEQKDGNSWWNNVGQRFLVTCIDCQQKFAENYIRLKRLIINGKDLGTITAFVKK